MKTPFALVQKLRLAALTALAATSLAAPAHAYWPGNEDGSWAHGRLVDVQIQVDGETAPLYMPPTGLDRHYFQAFAGRNYSLVLHNNTARRVGIVLAVDGLNVVSGERARLANDEGMYVLDPWESATIRGWRTSLDEVRRFVFVDEARSYAERTGQANGDMGWIRVLAFREQVAWNPWGTMRAFDRDPGMARDDRSRQDSQPASPEDSHAPPAAGAPQLQDGARKATRSLGGGNETDQVAPMAKQEGSFPGTGWGQRTNDHVNRVEFTAERRATDQLVFRYEYESGLRALGIFPSRDRLQDRDHGQLGFAKPPRW